MRPIVTWDLVTLQLVSLNPYAVRAVTFRRSPLALAILGLLENGPLHPYGIQRLIKQWGKDQVVNVGQRTSLYRMIVRLEEAGLITAGATERDERYPERTTYHLTDDGRDGMPGVAGGDPHDAAQRVPGVPGGRCRS